MSALTPTVHERIARCNTSVRVSGLVGGATVELRIERSGGTDIETHVATSSVHHFTVALLDGGDKISARQNDGGGFTPSSPQVIVEEAAVPPTAGPLLPAQVGGCSQCVHVTGLVPGCKVDLRQSGTLVGEGTADRHGNACIGVILRPRDRTGTLHARMIVCGVAGPMSATPIVPDPALPKPVVGHPLYGCQRMVPLSGLLQGARARMETNTGTDLGSICSCWNAVNVRVLHKLKVGEKVHAQQYWTGEACKDEGFWSDWRDVIEPDEGIKPTVKEALIEGDQTIRVDNQILGAEITVLIRDNESAPIESFGPRDADVDPEIMLNEPLVAGQQVAAVQKLCGHSEQSDWVTVLPLPEKIFAPLLMPPMYDCGSAVQVSMLHLGAVVRIYQDGIPCGLGFAGTKSSISVDANPPLVAGAQLTAIQWVGGVESPVSNTVIVQPVEGLHQPRVLIPVAADDTTVWVSGVTPGAWVSIKSGGALLGERRASEPIVRVPVTPVPGPIFAATRLCTHELTSATVSPIVSPCAIGTAADFGETFKGSYPPFSVPVIPVSVQTGDDGGFQHKIEGQLYYPADGSGKMDRVQDRPLVVIAHGYWDWDEEDQSYLGYAYLARHLARWGMFVFSVNLAETNDKVSSGIWQQSTRGEVILRAIDELFNDPALRGRLDRDRIGLVGHSMGGEGVVAAAVINLGRMAPYGIRGVVSLAPTHYRPDLQLGKANYLQLFGSMDYLLDYLPDVTGEGTGANPRFGGWRIYDRAWRPKSHLWIDKATHQGFNPNWWNSPNSSEGPLHVESLTLAQHGQIVKCMVNAFFQDALEGQSAYAGYLRGLIFPRGLYQYDIWVQHHRNILKVLDDFGDADNQLGFPEEAPPNKNTNRSGAGVSAGGGIVVAAWSDVEHITLPHSVHDTLSTDLPWSTPDGTYTSDAGASIALTENDLLSLRIAQHYEEDMGGDPVEDYNPVNQDIDLFVGLTGGGQEAILRLGSVGDVPYPTPESPHTLSVFRTVRLPLDAFKAVNSGLNLSSVTRVRLLLIGRATGRVLVDDIEFTPY